MAKKQLQAHEKFYIEQNPDNLSVKELAKMFAKHEGTIRNIRLEFKNKQLEKQPEEIKTETPAPTPDVNTNPPVPPTAVSNAMGTRRRNDEVVAVVMTQAASEIGDASRPKSKLSTMLSNAIHRPRGNKPK